MMGVFMLIKINLLFNNTIILKPGPLQLLSRWKLETIPNLRLIELRRQLGWREGVRIGGGGGIQIGGGGS